MASWNSIPLEITYQVLGWTAFLSWTLCYYPQLISNFRRKSVVGLSFDFVILNLTKHTSYLIHNAFLYFSSAIQKQYYKKYGYGQMIPVAANDVAFSIHAVLVTSVILLQIAIYERGGQKVSKITIAIVSVVWLFAAVCFFIALPSRSWLSLISIFNSIQVFMTVIKYIPQVRFVIPFSRFVLFKEMLKGLIFWSCWSVRSDNFLVHGKSIHALTSKECIGTGGSMLGSMCRMALDSVFEILASLIIY